MAYKYLSINQIKYFIRMIHLLKRCNKGYLSIYDYDF